MKRLVHVYLCKGTFLLHANSAAGNDRGPWLAESPGIRVSETSSDDALAEAILHVSNRCRSGIGMPKNPNNIPFPFAEFPDLKNWSDLARKAPVMVAVELEQADIGISRHKKESRAGYVPDQTFRKISMPAIATPAQIGASVRAAFS